MITAALMLIFYGLGLLNASKYTLSNVGYLGIAEIILGLICTAFPGLAFGFDCWFWNLSYSI